MEYKIRPLAKRWDFKSSVQTFDTSTYSHIHLIPPPTAMPHNLSQTSPAVMLENIHKIYNVIYNIKYIISCITICYWPCCNLMRCTHAAIKYCRALPKLWKKTEVGPPHFYLALWVSQCFGQFHFGSGFGSTVTKKILLYMVVFGYKSCLY